MTWPQVFAALFIVGSTCAFLYLLGAAVVGAVVGLLARLARRGEESGVPTGGTTVPPSNGSHDKLPSDLRRNRKFWELVDGLEVDR